MSVSVFASSTGNRKLLKWKATVLTTTFTGNYKKVKQLSTSVVVLKIRVVTKTDMKMRREKTGITLTTQAKSILKSQGVGQMFGRA